MELLRAAHIFQKIIGSTMIIITRAETYHQNIFKMESDQTKVALVSLKKPGPIDFYYYISRGNGLTKIYYKIIGIVCVRN